MLQHIKRTGILQSLLVFPGNCSELWNSYEFSYMDFEKHCDVKNSYEFHQNLNTFSPESYQRLLEFQLNFI